MTVKELCEAFGMDMTNRSGGRLDMEVVVDFNGQRLRLITESIEGPGWESGILFEFSKGRIVVSAEESWAS